MRAPDPAASITSDHFAAIVESSTDAIIGKDTDAIITSWNPAAQRIYGYSEAEAVGRPISILIPEDRRGEERKILDQILAGERLEEYETERVRKDGRQIRVSLTISPVRELDGQIVGASVIARDVTDKHRSKVLAERLQALTAALVGQVEVDRAVELLLEQAVKGTEADAGAVGVIDEAGDQVELIGSFGHSEEGLSPWRRFPLDSDVPMTEVIRTGKTMWFASADEMRNRYPLVWTARIRFDCLAVVPLTVDGETFGSLSLSFVGARTFDAEMEAFVTAVAERAAHALERARLREAEQQTARQLELLAEASELLSESLELDVTLARLADLVVQRIADWCSIELLDSEGRLRGSTVAHQDPAQRERALRLREMYPPETTGDEGLARVLRTGETEVYADIPDELLAASARDEKHLELMRELGLKSAIVAPLTVRGRTLGALTIVAAESGRRYGPGEVQLVRDLARRAALAIDNSMLFEREHEAAVTLQRSLLPQSLPEIEGMELATRYEPAAPGLEVGGDWYEVVVRDDGKVGVTIGDVAGRGIRAASVMGRIRPAFRAYVLEGHDPVEAITRLNRLIREAERPEMVTVLHLLLDPVTGEGSYVRAGHPPALLLDADGNTEALLGNGTTPLGILSDAEVSANPVKVPPGSLLLLYTDGLIERRDTDLDVGLARLRRALADGPRDAQGCLDWLAERLEADDVPDDVAMLAVSR